MTIKLKFKHFFVFFFFFTTFFLYISNSTRDVYSGDIGDLVTAAYVFGVPHPSGYPLFTFLGFLFSHVPLLLPVVTKVTFISIFSSMTSLFIFYKFATQVTKNLYLSLLSTSILAFSYFFWLFTEIPEVFSLNIMFALLIVFFALRFYQRKQTRDLYITIFLSSLSLSHHQTILFLFPSISFLLLAHWRIVFSSPKRVVIIALLGIIGFFPYLYVPFAAFKNPIVNWDNAISITNLVHLILRKDYGIAPAVVNGIPPIVKFIVVKDFFSTLASLYSYQIFFVGLLGIVQLLKTDKKILISLLIAFLLTGPCFLFYAAPYITTTTAWGITERFYFLSSVLFLLFVPYGFIMLQNLLQFLFTKRIYTTVFLFYFLMIPFFLISYNLPKTDLSKTTIGNTLAYDMLTTLPKNAVLMVHGDTKTFNVWYVHYVLGYRPDISIINPPGVASNNYFDEEINAFRKKNPKTSLKEIGEKTFLDIRKRRSIYAGYTIQNVGDDSVWIPKGLAYQLIYKKDIPTENQYITQITNNIQKLHIARRETLPLYNKNLITPEIPSIYSNAFVSIGDFLIDTYHAPKKAIEFYQNAVLIDNENPTAYAGLGLSQYKADANCTSAIQNLKIAINRYSIWRSYYAQLYILYDLCNTDSKTIHNLQNEYYTRFKLRIEDHELVRTSITYK